jgi:hypothetical protein
MASGETHTGSKHGSESRPLYIVNSIAYDEDRNPYMRKFFKIKKVYKTLDGKKLKTKKRGKVIKLYKDKRRWRGPFLVKVKYYLKSNNKKLLKKLPRRDKTSGMAGYYENQISIGLKTNPTRKNKYG